MLKIKEQHGNLAEELKRKENHVTDLEFELLSLNSDLNRSSHSFCEKRDTDNEKHSLFWAKQIEDKDKEIERLESELRKRTCDLQGIVNKELWQKNREIEKLQNRFGNILENKDQEINKLERSVSDKNLQLKLLKEKISELGVHVPSDLMVYTEVQTNPDVCDETKILQERLRASLEEKKYFIEQIEDLQQKLNKVDNRELLQLQVEYKDLQEELENSEKLRLESTEICSILNTRLEELAQFLHSLLQQKSVLGFLGLKRNEKLKQIVNHSLELSHTLSITISQNPNQSLVELSNISALLNSTRNLNLSMTDFLAQGEDNASLFSITPSDVTLTYRSHLQTNTDKRNETVVEEQAKIINVLREQIENLKHEIELRDTELNKLTSNDNVENNHDVLLDFPKNQGSILSSEKVDEELVADKSKSGLCNTSTTLKNRTENQSESESWSEPDRIVSLARIGLDDESLKPTNSSMRRSRFLTNLSTESTEDELSRTLTRTPSKRSLLAENRQTIISLHGEVCELETKLKEKENELLTMQVSYFETDNLLKTEYLSKESRQKELDEMVMKVKDIEEKLFKADERKESAEHKIKELEKTIADLEITKSELQLQLEFKDKCMMNRINEVEVEKMKAIEAAKQAEKVAVDAKFEIEKTVLKLRCLEQEMAGIEGNVRKACENEFKKQMGLARDEYETRIQNVERRAEREIHEAYEAIENMKSIMERDYVNKCDLDQKVREIEIMTSDLERAKCSISITEDKLHQAEQHEEELKQKLRDAESQYRDKISELHKDLDSATLQYSEAVLEKTKLANEKTILEQQLKAVDIKETELLVQVAEFQKEFCEMKDVFHSQVAAIESQKLRLEIRVSELESVNAELRNKLIKLQTGFEEQLFSTSLPTSLSRMYELCNHNIPVHQIAPYRRQCSDISGYTSEDQPADEVKRNFIVNEQVPSALVDTERHQANSSPDLGIESDQGRFSSLEVTIPRPLLQTLELTESMNSLLDGDFSQVQTNNCSKYCNGYIFIHSLGSG